MTFLREYFGAWILDSRGKRLQELAYEYHDLTESYDRTVCTGPIIRGGIMPTTPKERSLINRYARRIYNELGFEAVRLGFTLKEWQRAVCNSSRH